MKKTVKNKTTVKSTKNKKPLFIVLEGGEGSGKTSLILALKNALVSKHITTREPGGSPYAEVIRTVALKDSLAGSALPETTMCLMFAARFDHAEKLIAQTLKKGVSVISDRFDASSYAYNVFAQSNGKLNDVFWNLRKQLAVLPDLYIYVDVDPKEGIRRAQVRNKSNTDGNYFDDQEIDFHNKVQKGYRAFFKHKGIKSVVLDGSKSLANVTEDFISVVKKELGEQ